MVWSVSQTPLYQAVKAHNERNSEDSERSEPHTKQEQCEQREHRERSKPRKPVREQAASSPNPRGIDRDMLLILMVIFILQNEKADDGLILALLMALIM